MKYEAVFGNQELFDGAGTFTGLDVVVHSIASGIKSYARLSDLTPESLRNHPVCAMRRIIKEPKRWTVADQNAGRLPEVGGECVGCNSGYEKSVVYVDDWFVVVKQKNDGYVVTFDHSSFLSAHKPLESPREKYERERDEYIKSIIESCSSQKDAMQTMYNNMKPFKEETK